MKSNLRNLLEEYGESHQTKQNQLIHYICVPIIFFSIISFFKVIPIPAFFQSINSYLDWSLLALVFVLIYYIRLSFKLFVLFLPFAFLLYYLNELLFQYFSFNLFWLALLFFVLSWVGQFYGHHIEGKKPSFLKDIQFLLIGPAWLVYKLLNLKAN